MIILLNHYFINYMVLVDLNINFLHTQNIIKFIFLYIILLNQGFLYRWYSYSSYYGPILS